MLLNSIAQIRPQAFDLSETIETIERSESSFDVFKQLKHTGAAFRLEHFIVAKQPPGSFSQFAQRVIITNWDAELLARFIEDKTFDRSWISDRLRNLTTPSTLCLSENRSADNSSMHDEERIMVGQGYDRIAYFPIQLDCQTRGAVSFSGSREPVETEEMAQLFLISRYAFARLTKVSASAAPQNPLTAREIEIFELVAEGSTAEEIGRRLKITSHTVNYHIGNAVHKLGAKNKIQALVTALQNGWLSRSL